MIDFLSFFLIIFAGVFFSTILGRFHIPWVVTLIIGGIIIGPHALGFVEATPTLDFISQIGLIFLMFMAGLETKLSSFGNFRGKLLFLSFINGGVPFALGLIVTLLFGYDLLTAFLIGIIFVSSSIAVIIPALERQGILHTTLGQSVTLSTIIQDITSLLLLSLLLQTIDFTAALPLYLLYPLLIATFFLLRFAIPKIRAFFSRPHQYDIFQQEFRTLFLILLGTVLLFELLGLHPIIAAFIAGLILSESVHSPELKTKVYTISYGIFIPVFFVLIGTSTDISVFFSLDGALLLTITIIATSILSKFVSGWIGGRLVGFSNSESIFFGATSIPQLSTTLAVVFTAHELGLLDETLSTAMVLLSIVTTLISPSLMHVLGKKIEHTT